MNVQSRSRQKPFQAASAWLVFLGAIGTLPVLRHWLMWERGGDALWRWVSCQLAHWSWEHFVYDGLMLLALGVLLERESKIVFWVALTGSIVFVPATVSLFCANIDTYAGLSGIDSAFFVALALVFLVKTQRWQKLVPILGLLAFCGKILWELLTQTALFVSDGTFVPVPQAHLAGALAGGIAFWLGFLRMSGVSRKNPG